RERVRDAQRGADAVLFVRRGGWTDRGLRGDGTVRTARAVPVLGRRLRDADPRHLLQDDGPTAGTEGGADAICALVAHVAAVRPTDRTRRHAQAARRGEGNASTSGKIELIKA